MDIRKAAMHDVESILKIRLDFIYEVTKSEFPPGFKVDTYTYLQRHIADDTLICYIAVDEDAIASIVMMSTYEVLPTLGNPSGKTGYLFNVYTPALYRRRGLSSTLMRHLIEEARRLGIGEILLDYTAEGKSLYEKLGFQPLDKDMVLKVK